jgi:hypothetical protein
LGEQISNRDSDLTPEECLQLWRAENPTPTELHKSVAAVKEALADMEAGDTGKPFDEFVEEFRTKHNIPQDA